MTGLTMYIGNDEINLIFHIKLGVIFFLSKGNQQITNSVPIPQQNVSQGFIVPSHQQVQNLVQQRQPLGQVPQGVQERNIWDDVQFN